mmetsp:Transcript_32140/g.5815  ORF Transcript_32140/g.5815 Transcript_32140/m.5815 type:complete len:93 (+) Transcript_32140:404-682(+)
MPGVEIIKDHFIVAGGVYNGKWRKSVYRMSIQDYSYDTIPIKLPSYLLRPNLVDIGKNRVVVLGGFKDEHLKLSKEVYIFSFSKGLIIEQTL